MTRTVNPSIRSYTRTRPPSRIRLSIVSPCPYAVVVINIIITVIVIIVFGSTHLVFADVVSDGVAVLLRRRRIDVPPQLVHALPPLVLAVLRRRAAPRRPGRRGRTVGQAAQRVRVHGEMVVSDDDAAAVARQTHSQHRPATRTRHRRININGRLFLERNIMF